MTEPAVASSDATNIRTEIERDGDNYVINGRKWWTSGAGDPRCKIVDRHGPDRSRRAGAPAAVDGAGADGHARRQGRRPLSVFGYDDAPHGHGEVMFENVRVPVANILLGEGRGFEIAQGRLGPGPHPSLHAHDRRSPSGRSRRCASAP